MRKIVCDLCKKDISDYMIHEATLPCYEYVKEVSQDGVIKIYEIPTEEKLDICQSCSNKIRNYLKLITVEEKL